MQDQRHDRELTADLIGYHLGLCDEADRARVEHAFGDSLGRARANVARLLAPLDGDVVSPPTDLVAGILDRVAEARNRLPLRPLPTADAETTTASPMFSLRELLSLAAAIAMFVGIFVPGYRAAQMNSRQAACANNLRQIGNGSVKYAEMFPGSSPMLSSLPDGISWVPRARPTAARSRQSNMPYQYVRFQIVPPSALTCPGREEDAPLAAQNPQDLDDFPDPRNNSYSTQLVPQHWQAQRQQPLDIAAADLTPLVDQQRQLNANGPISLNSTSHSGKGQNVLRRDISVIFSRTPNVGIDNDDIYRVIGVQHYTGLERPRLRSDAFLVP